MKYDKVVIKSSTKQGKKMMATFSSEGVSRSKTIHFGQAGAPDYTRKTTTIFRTTSS